MRYSLQLILLVLLITGSLNNQARNNLVRNEVRSELDNVQREYGDIFFECLFSLEEYRKIFVVIKPISPDFPVTTPLMVVKNLSKDQKEKIYTKTSEFIQSLSKKEVTTKISQIKHWCLTKKQYEVISKFDDYSIDFFVDAINETLMMQDLFKEMYQNSNQSPASFSTAQLDGVYYESINVASTWPFLKLKEYYIVLLEKIDFR